MSIRKKYNFSKSTSRNFIQYIHSGHQKPSISEYHSEILSRFNCKTFYKSSQKELISHHTKVDICSPFKTVGILQKIKETNG